MFNLKNKDAQNRFNEMTSENDSLASIFDTDDDLNTCTRKFIKKLDDYIYKCFKKIRLA